MEQYKKAETANIFNAKVSLFECVTNSSTPIGVCKIGDFINDPKHRTRVDIFRQYLTKQHFVDGQRFKKNYLRAATMEMTCTTRIKNGIEEHSGVMCIDIDHPKDIEATKRILAQDPYIAYAGYSCSGSGLYALIPISNPEYREDYFRAMVEYFLDRGIEIDTACKDVTRLRIASYDDNPIINESAQVWTIRKEVFVSTPTPTPTQRYYVSTTSRYDEQTDLFYACLNEIARTSTDIAPEYGQWLSVASSVKTLLGESGRQPFHTISQCYSKGNYDFSTTEKMFDTAQGSGYGLGVFLNACRRAGLQDASVLLFAERRAQRYE